MYDHARFHAQLRVWIYADQTLTEVARPSLIAAFGVFIAGMLIAIPKDAQWARSRRHGRRLKGPELVSARRFNRRMRANGIAFRQMSSLPAKLLGIRPTLRIPRAIESSHLPGVAGSIAPSACRASDPLGSARVYMKNYDRIVRAVSRTDARRAQRVAAQAFRTNNPMRWAKRYLAELQQAG